MENALVEENSLVSVSGLVRNGYNNIYAVVGSDIVDCLSSNLVESAITHAINVNGILLVAKNKELKTLAGTKCIFSEKIIALHTLNLDVDYFIVCLESGVKYLARVESVLTYHLINI